MNHLILLTLHFFFFQKVKDIFFRLSDMNQTCAVTSISLCTPCFVSKSWFMLLLQKYLITALITMLVHKLH